MIRMGQEASKSSEQLSKREHDIRIVMEERAKMVKTGQEILTLLGKFPYKPEPDRTEIQKKLLEFTAYVANISGFCAPNWRNMIVKLEDYLGLSMTRLNFDMRLAPHLAGLMQMAVGIQVDFTKGPPFRLIGFDVKAFKAQVKGIVKR